jgi:hypothetical protein
VCCVAFRPVKTPLLALSSLFLKLESAMQEGKSQTAKRAKAAAKARFPCWTCRHHRSAAKQGILVNVHCNGAYVFAVAL